MLKATDEEKHMFFCLIPILGAGHVTPTQEPAAYHAV